MEDLSREFVAEDQELNAFAARTHDVRRWCSAVEFLSWLVAAVLLALLVDLATR